MAITPATATPVTSGTISSQGIGSGLDVNGIVSKLMAVESQPLTALNTKEAAVQAKISAYGSIKSALSSFQSSLAGLLDPTAYSSFVATPGDTSVLSARTGAGAGAGSYAITVSQLAQSQKLSSAGFSNATSVVGSGTLTFAFGTFAGSTFTPNGTAGTKTVAIGAGQNTLTGIRDAVNAAGIGVTASIVNDGSAAGNHLVFTSTSSGAANSLKVSVADADGTNSDASGLSQLAYDPAAAAGSGKNLTQNVAAQDAQLTIDGIAISKPGNTITDALQGITLNLTKTNVGSTTTLSVTQSNGAIANAVQAFVKAYNDANTTLVNLTKYDASSGTGAVLTGDSTARLVQSQLTNIISHAVGSGGAASSSASSALTTLSQVGVNLQQDGTLTVDTAALNTALTNNSASVAALFSAVGQSSDSLTTVTGSSDNTKAGNYAVNITRLATQGRVAGSAAAGLTITAGVNDQLSVSVDGIASTITIAPGTYSSANALAAEVQADINGASAIAANGSSVAVSATGGTLSITSTRFGSVSVLTASGNALANLLGSAPTTTAGVDVAGTIGGVPGGGSGQTLTGPSGSAVDGLKLLINGGTTGARGGVTFSRGYASQLNATITQLIGASGIVAASTDGANRSVDDIDAQRASFSAHLTVVEAQYRAQFTALDTLISSMNSTSTFLTQQLASLPKITVNGS